MTSLSRVISEIPPGEGLRRALLCAVCLGAVGVAVVFSPAVGPWRLGHAGAQLAVIRP